MSQPADTVRAAIRTLRDLGDAVQATVTDAVNSTDRDQISERLRDLPFQAVRLAVAGVGQAIAFADRVQNLLEEQGLDTTNRDNKNRDTQPARRPEGHAGRSGSVVQMPQHNDTEDAARAQRAAARRAERPARSVPNRRPAAPRPTSPKTTAPKATTRQETARQETAPKTAAPNSGARKRNAPKAAGSPKTAPSKTAPSKTAASKTAASKTAASKTVSGKGAGAADLPVPDYDTASLASVRGRLRNLTQADLRKLRSYEKANAARPAFLTMYDNRLAKLRDSSD